MRKKINLFWFKLPKGSGNFGDELNPYIFDKLFPIKFEYVDVSLLSPNRWLGFKRIIYKFLKSKIKFRKFIRYFIFDVITRPRVFLAVGSVLNLKYPNVIVWGSGIISQSETTPRGKYLAVRGQKTIEKIKKDGGQPPNFVGDPALLLPQLYQPCINKSYKLGIIPHYIHYDLMKQEFHSNKIRVINLLDPIEKVIDEILSCELTISTSLHGIIVSHAYRINSIWATYTPKALAGDDIKFEDYFSSVQLENYDPLSMSLLFDMSLEEILNLINGFEKEDLLPDSEIIFQIQEDLLDVFPYR